MPQILVLEDEELSELLEIVNASGSSNHPALLASFGATVSTALLNCPPSWDAYLSFFSEGLPTTSTSLTGVPAVSEHLSGIQMLLASSVSCPSHFIEDQQLDKASRPFTPFLSLSLSSSLTLHNFPLTGNPMFSPLSSSQHSFLLTSPPPGLNGNGKRIGEEHSEAPAVKKVMLLVPMLAQVQGKMREAGSGAGGDAAAGGDRKAGCPQKGDGASIGGDDDIEDVDCDYLGFPIYGNGDNDDDNNDDEDKDKDGHGTMAWGVARTAKSKKGLSKSKSKGKGKEKGKSKHPLGYTIKGTGPPLTKDAGFLLSAPMASIFFPGEMHPAGHIP
ncbi:hypothetical protein B0H14DRAFT_2638079 [Mycena olivaceomarginata]|nr:hypothetical protein B0H14DRAFT_2638079 [Mycena olivaceomarginata]